MATTIKAHAKLNLFLEITGKRPNGYHELHSLVVFLDLADEITIEPSSTLEITGNNIPDNILLKAANLLQKKYSANQGAKITLRKKIPIGGGLGGGSADAAATLYLLNKFWNLHRPVDELYKIALELGADVPVCLYSIINNKNSGIFKGIGDIIEPVAEISGQYFVLVNPKKELLTANVFKNIEYTPRTKKNYFSGDFLQDRYNDLETSAIKLLPEIAEILKAISSQEGCELSRMTGSGATCFGIFRNEAYAKAAALTISDIQPKWWVELAREKH